MRKPTVKMDTAFTFDQVQEALFGNKLIHENSLEGYAILIALMHDMTKKTVCAKQKDIRINIDE